MQQRSDFAADRFAALIVAGPGGFKDGGPLIVNALSETPWRPKSNSCFLRRMGAAFCLLCKSLSRAAACLACSTIEAEERRSTS